MKIFGRDVGLATKEGNISFIDIEIVLSGIGGTLWLLFGDKYLGALFYFFCVLWIFGIHRRWIKNWILRGYGEVKIR